MFVAYVSLLTMIDITRYYWYDCVTTDFKTTEIKKNDIYFVLHDVWGSHCLDRDNLFDGYYAGIKENICHLMNLEYRKTTGQIIQKQMLHEFNDKVWARLPMCWDIHFDMEYYFFLVVWHWIKQFEWFRPQQLSIYKILVNF